MKAKIKQQLYKKLNYKQPYENSINISLISTYSELLEILNAIENKTKFFYLDKEEIYEIMYKEEEVIPIESKKYEYSFLYYLSLIIEENKEMVNFNFGIDFIKENDNDNKIQGNELQKLFVSRIILDLIYNYEGTEKNEELKEIKEKNKIYITNNIKLFKKYNLNLKNIEEISLESLYLNILIELIKNKKLENYDFIFDILTKLDLENIDLNQNMLKEIKNILDDERYINDYKMNNIEDFFFENKINFYYILIKYIFKNSFFIYNIPLLYNTRNKVIEIIKNKKEEFLSLYNNINFDLVKRINYNIKFILDSNYYYNIFIDIIFDYILEEAHKNNSENWKEYMKDLNISENIIEKMALIKYLYESIKKDEEKAQIEFKDITNAYNQLEKMIKDKKIKKMRKDDKLILSKYFIDINNKDSLLRIFGQDSYDFFLKESIKLNEIEKKEKQNKLKEILKYYKMIFFESKKEDISTIENAINDKGDLDYKKYEPDFEKAKMLNDRMILINYLYKIKDENKTESEMQKIIEKYNALEQFISERNSMKDINIDNETKFKLLDYFNDKNNEEFLIKIFGKENYEFVLQYFNENKNDNKNVETNKNINTDKYDKNNTKENYSGIKKQNNRENGVLNIFSSKSTKVQTTDKNNIELEQNNNLSEHKLSIEEKLANHILTKSEVILNTKKEEGKLSFIFDSVNYGNYQIFISYEKLQQIEKYLNSIQNITAKSFMKYMEFLDEFINRIRKEFKLEYKLKIGLEFKNNNKTDNDSIFNIDCNYKFYSPLDVKSIQEFKEENVLMNKTKSETQGFYYLINEINEECFKEIKFQDSPPNGTNRTSDNNLSQTISQNLSDFRDSNLEIRFDLKKEAKNYEILEIIDILGEHKKTAEFIIELSNGYYISGGTDNILKIYDKGFNQIEEIKDIPEWTYSCFEKEKLLKQKENDYKIELIACCNKILYQIILSFKDGIKHKYQKYELPQLKAKSCIHVKENNFAIIGQNSSAYFIDLFNPDKKKLKNNSIVSGKSYIGSIKINQNIIAITSNKVQYYGEDKLIFYNIDENKISREIKGYSFTSGTNGLALMPREEIKAKNRILLCACTKYIDNQKNGIYLANPQMEDNKLVNNPFYDTGNFEVFCFCPILIINPHNECEENGKQKEIIDTDYFFVGGFNKDKSEGEIKLFKVIYSEKAYNNKIEFVQNIEFERNKDFNGFEGAISCIIQIKKGTNGNLLVTCYNGKVYLLTKPNLDYYMNIKDTKTKNSNEI